jgi:hypothetical protein
MARRKIETRVELVDGREYVLVAPDDFAALESVRRQLGAQSTQANRVRQRLEGAMQVLTGARETVGQVQQLVANLDCRCDPPHRCDRCQAVDLLADIAASVEGVAHASRPGGRA